MRLTPREYMYVAVAVLAGFLVPGWRKAIGIVIFFVGLPAVYHLLKKDDDSDLNLGGLLLIFVGIALFVSGHL